MKDYATQLGSTAVATIATSFGVVVESAASDGIDKTTGWALGIIAGGTAVFGWFWKQYREQENERAADRRAADERLIEQNETLEAEVLSLQTEVRVLYRQLLDQHRRDD